MTAMMAFLGLLVLAYLGNILVSGRSVRGYGLPSGVEYLLLGFVVGPSVLGLVSEETLIELRPLLFVGAGWLLLLTGLNWGVLGGKRARVRGFVGSFLLAVVTGVAIVGAVWWTAGRVTPYVGRERWFLAASIAAVGMETTRIAVRWVFERHGADGPLSRSIAALADSDELPALLLVAGLFVLAPLPQSRISLPPLVWFLLTLALGVVLALTCVALMGPKLHRGEALGFVLGAALLGTGVTVRLGLSGVTALFVLGLTLALASPHREELRAELKKSEHPVLLPVLLLTGALVRFEGRALPWILAAALAARFVGKISSGLVLYAFPSGRPAGPWLGLGLLSSGVVTLVIALTLSLRLENEIGNLTLAVAAGMTLFGEMIGPLSLRRSLGRAGELDGKRTTSPPPEVQPLATAAPAESEVSS